MSGQSGQVSRQPNLLPVTFALVISLALAPAVVRALQRLDCRFATPTISYSRSGELPPLKVKIDPASLLACAVRLGLIRPPLTSRHEPTVEEHRLLAPFDSSPDPVRGPPAVVL
jgi:hypothetical protein